MKKINVSIKFINASGGNSHVVIQSASVNFNYDVDGSKGVDNRSFHLWPGLYTIRVHGITGGTCVLSIDGDLQIPVQNSCDGPNVYMQQQFIVQ